MASETFLRLDDVKRQKLLDIAIKEFSRVNYNEVSINRIIKEAGISRGSFYMYFENKNDLYFYLLDKYQKEFIKAINDTLNDYHNSLFLMFYYVIDKFYLIVKVHREFFVKSLENITLLEEHEGGFLFKKKISFQMIKENIDLSQFDSLALKHLDLLFTISMHILIVNLIKLLKDGYNCDIIDNYREELKLFYRGSLKGDKNDKDI